MKKDKQSVEVGDWAYFCCEKELRRINSRQELGEIRDGWDEEGWSAFTTRNEALFQIAEDWRKSGYPALADDAISMMDLA